MAALLALSLVSVGGIVITGQVVGRSLLLGGLPASAIPLRFIVPPLVLVAATALYSRVVAGGAQRRVIAGTFLALTAGVLAARLLVGTGAGQSRVFLLALFSFLDVAGSLAMILFWTVAGIVFDSRQARRLFGLISSGSGIANVAFGLFLAETARRVRPESLMWVIVASLLASAALVLHLVRAEAAPSAEFAGGRTSAPEPRPRPGILAGLRHALASPLVVVLASIAIVIALVSNIVDYQLDLALKQAYGADTGAMAVFLARLRLAAGLAAFGVQLFLVRPVMERFGIVAALLVLPGTIGLGSAGIVLTGGALWAVAAPRVADVALKFSINDAAFNLLYLPLRPEARSRAKAVVDGVLKPPVVAGLGLLFLVLGRTTSVPIAAWSVPALALVGLWAWLVRLAERRYVAALSESIALRRCQPSDDAPSFADDTSRRVLAEALRDPDPARVIHALSLVPSSGGDFSTDVAPLLGHDVSEVRIAALSLPPPGAANALASAIRQRLDDPDPGVREAAVRAYSRALGPLAVSELAARLGHPHPGTRAAAVASLVKDGGLAGFLHAGAHLHAMLASPEPAERRAGARILGNLAVPSFYHPILELLWDEDPSVRLAAIEAAEACGSPELLPALSILLEEPLLRRPVTAAMVACAGGDLAVLQAELENRDRPAEVRVAVARSLRRWRGRGVALLVAAAGDDDPRVRGAALETLRVVLEDGVPVHGQAARLSARLDAEIEEAYRRCAALHGLRKAVPEASLLLETLAREVAADRARIVDLLVLLHPNLQEAALHDALEASDPRRRAEALELVDSVATATRSLVVPYLGGTDAERLEVAERRLAIGREPALTTLAALAGDPRPWVRACACDALSRAGMAGAAPVVEARLSDPDPLVAAAARTAGRRLAKEADMPMAALERILFLKRVPLFRDIPAEEIAGILDIVEQVSFPAGTTIIRQGDVGDALFIIVEGSVTVEVDGRPQPRPIGSTGVIGELAILADEPRRATCTAATEVAALRIRKEPFWRLMRERPEVSFGVIRILLEYLRRPPAVVPAAPAPGAGPAEPSAA